MSELGKLIGKVSAALDPILSQPKVTALIGVEPVRLRYTGRRSGRSIELNVWAKPTDQGVVVEVGAASAKSWWRNFRGERQPIEVRRSGVWHHGSAIADEGSGKTLVRITLDDSR